MSKAEIVQFAQYRVMFGRGYYRHGRLYRRANGDTVVLPVNEQPPSCLGTMLGKRPKWDAKKGVVTNATILAGTELPKQVSKDELVVAAEKLSEEKKDVLMTRAHGLGLDVNGTKKELALAIVKAENERDSADDPDSDDEPTDDLDEGDNSVKEVGGAT